MNKELKKLLKAVKDLNWTATQEDGNVFDFGWYSPCGQDFHITVDTENDVGCFLHNLYSVYEDFAQQKETRGSELSACFHLAFVQNQRL